VSILEEIKARFKKGDALVRLLFVNAAVFLLLTIYLLIMHVGAIHAPAWLGEDLGLAALSNLARMAYRPWSIVTHMFTHIQFGHFLFNMIALYTMGQLFVSLKGSRKLTALYLLGGFSGYVLFVLSYNLLPVFHTTQGSYVLGASAAVMAITVATATLDPSRVIYIFGAIKLELKWLAAILVLLDLASVRSGINSGGHIGHIGGALFGFIYARQLQKGNDMGRWMDNIISRLGSLFSKKRMTVASTNARAKSDEQFNLEKKARQKRVDEILDRISRSGYDSLSKDEKEFLFKNSQR